MFVEINKYNDIIKISDETGFSKKYIGYSVKDAKKMFKKEQKENNSKTIFDVNWTDEQNKKAFNSHF